LYTISNNYLTKTDTKLALKYYYHELLACYRIKCVQDRKHKKMKAFLYSVQR